MRPAGSNGRGSGGEDRGGVAGFRGGFAGPVEAPATRVIAFLGHHVFPFAVLQGVVVVGGLGINFRAGLFRVGGVVHRMVNVNLIRQSAGTDGKEDEFKEGVALLGGERRIDRFGGIAKGFESGEAVLGFVESCETKRLGIHRFGLALKIEQIVLGHNAGDGGGLGGAEILRRPVGKEGVESVGRVAVDVPCQT